jgi:hypothetical protein
MRSCLLLLVVLLCLPSCASAPPNLSPAASQAFQKTRVIKALDVLRDFAIDAEAAVPQVLPTATTRKVVQYHQSALKIMQATDSGWKEAVAAGLTELVATLAPDERAKFTPYVTLVQTLLREVL